MPILSIIVLVPLAGAIVVVVARRDEVAKWIGLASILGSLMLALCLPAAYRWDKELEPSDRVWIESRHAFGTVRKVDAAARALTVDLLDRPPLKTTLTDARIASVYAYGVQGRRPGAQPGFAVVQLVERSTLGPGLLLATDGITSPLLILLSILFLLGEIIAWKSNFLGRSFTALRLLVQACFFGALLAWNPWMYFGFVLAALAILVILIRSFGGNARVLAWRKAFLHLCLIAVTSIAAVILAERQFHLLDFVTLARSDETSGKPVVGVIFLLLLVAILTLLGSFPFHLWVFDALSEAPLPVAVVLPGALAAVGASGCFHLIVVPFGGSIGGWWVAIPVIGLVNMLYGSLCLRSAPNLPRFIGSSWMAQTGMLLLGFGMLTPAAINGAIFCAIAQGLCGAMMIYLAGLLRLHGGQQNSNRIEGSFDHLPRFRIFWLITFFAFAGLPGLCGFVATVLVLIGTFQATRANLVVPGGSIFSPPSALAVAILACLGTPLMTTSCLVAIRRLIFGDGRAEQANLKDLEPHELRIAGVLVALSAMLGIAPNPLVFAFTGKTVSALFVEHRDVKTPPRLDP